MGLSPRGVLQAVNQAFLQLPREQIVSLASRRRPLALKHSMVVYDSKRQPRLIDLQMRPWVMTRAQETFFYKTCRLLNTALDKIVPLYLHDPKVRQIVPLEPYEEEWLRAANARKIQAPRTVFGRIDATATFASPQWKNDFWFLEPNEIGIGGVYYIYGTMAMANDWVLPLLKEKIPAFHPRMGEDPRRLLFLLLRRHARAIGRPLRRVALVEDRSEPEGTAEFSSVARSFRQWGLDAFLADPRQVIVRRGEITVRGKPVDLIYRDTELTEMFEMAGDDFPRRFSGMREAFMQNRVISSLAGEFDHKSCWELFTNPEFARQFTPKQKQLFRKHILWTRLLWERTTTDWAGKRIDLTAFARRNRARLVLKPNRAYGGEGVLFGWAVSPSRWDRALAGALRQPFQWIIQRAAPVHEELFPEIRPGGRLRLEPFFAVTGFAATPDGMAVLGRFSGESVVNVSRRGGLIPIFRCG